MKFFHIAKTGAVSSSTNFQVLITTPFFSNHYQAHFPRVLGIDGTTFIFGYFSSYAIHRKKTDVEKPSSQVSLLKDKTEPL